MNEVAGAKVDFVYTEGFNNTLWNENSSQKRRVADIFSHKEYLKHTRDNLEVTILLMVAHSITLPGIHLVVDKLYLWWKVMWNINSFIYFNIFSRRTLSFTSLHIICIRSQHLPLPQRHSYSQQQPPSMIEGSPQFLRSFLAASCAEAHHLRVFMLKCLVLVYFRGERCRQRKHRKCVHAEELTERANIILNAAAIATWHRACQCVPLAAAPSTHRSLPSALRPL